MLHEYLQIVRSFNRDVRLYLLSGALVGFASSSGIYSLLLNIYLLRLGHDIGFVGFVNATGAASYALFCIPAGAMGRRWGARRMIVLGLALVAVGNAMLPFAEFVPRAWQAHWLIFARLPRAFGFALSIVNAGPFLLSITTRVERIHVFAVQAAMWPIAGFAGNLVGGVLPGIFAALMEASLDGPAPYRYPLFLAAVMIVPAVLAVAATRPAAGSLAGGGPDAESPRPRGPMTAVAGAGFLCAISMATQQTFFNVYMDDFLGEPTALIGAVAATAMLVSGLAALSTPLIVASRGQRATIIATSLLQAAALLPVMLSGNWAAAACTLMLVQSLAAVRLPTLTVFQQEIVPPRWRQGMAAVSSMAMGCSFMLTGSFGGQVIAASGYGTLFAIAAVASIAGTVLFAIYFHPARNEELKTAAAQPA